MTLTQDIDGRWRLDTNGELLGYDGENMACVLAIQTDTGAEWTYYADIEYLSRDRATLPLIYDGGILRAEVGAAYLQPGNAAMQIRAVDGTLVKKSNISRVSIGWSINATEELEPLEPSLWDVYAAQVAQLRDEALSAADRAEDAAERAEESGGISFTTDETLTLENGVLRVNTANSAEQDNTLPITSAAVHTTVGNIEVLLAAI